MKGRSYIENVIDELIDLGLSVGKYIKFKQKKINSSKLAYYEILTFLALKPARTMNEIAKEMVISMPAATKLAVNLIKLKYAKRVNDKNDRRKVKLIITNQGLEELQTLRENMRDIFKKLYIRLTDSEIKSYIKIRSKIERIMRDEMFGEENI